MLRSGAVRVCVCVCVYVCVCVCVCVCVLPFDTSALKVYKKVCFCLQCISPQYSV